MDWKKLYDPRRKFNCAARLILRQIKEHTSSNSNELRYHITFPKVEGKGISVSAYDTIEVLEKLNEWNVVAIKNRQESFSAGRYEINRKITIFDIEILQPKFNHVLFPQGISYTRGSGFGTAKLGQIFELNRQSRGQKSNLVAPTGIEPVFLR